MCSLFAYITSLQHNIISNFFPTNELVISVFFVNTLEICLLSVFSTLIYQQIYVWYSCIFVSSICVYIVFVLLNSCPMHGEFPSDEWLMPEKKKNIFKGEIKVISNKIFEN